MSNVNKVKLLSERTYGVPSVIFECEVTPSERTFFIFFPPVMCQRPELSERKCCIYQTHVPTENLLTVFGYLNFLSVCQILPKYLLMSHALSTSSTFFELFSIPVLISTTNTSPLF